MLTCSALYIKLNRINTLLVLGTFNDNFTGSIVHILYNRSKVKDSILHNI
jgi:hypothetical protein